MAHIFMPWAGIQEANGAESADQQRQWLDVAWLPLRCLSRLGWVAANQRWHPSRKQAQGLGKEVTNSLTTIGIRKGRAKILMKSTKCHRDFKMTLHKISVNYKEVKWPERRKSRNTSPKKLTFVWDAMTGADKRASKWVKISAKWWWESVQKWT